MQKFKIVVDSQTQMSGVIVEADSYRDIDDRLYFMKGHKTVAVVPTKRIMAILIADEDGSFEGAIANNDTEHLMDGMRYAHDRISALDQALAETQNLLGLIRQIQSDLMDEAEIE